MLVNSCVGTSSKVPRFSHLSATFPSSRKRLVMVGDLLVVSAY